MSSLTGRLFGHYRILERVGRGGMATVYHADDRKSGRDVAIKFISPALAENEDFLKRFRREVKLVARLDHPNIVPVYDYGEQEGYAYLVMPYLPIGSLTDRMKQGSISLDEGGKLLDQVAAGLDYAHRHGIVHRDIKPSNILLDAQGNALLGDFGLARSNESTLSLTGSALIGTPAYIAPEQVKGDQVDARCDQYALGVILFQLATGRLPFEAPTPMGLVLKHVSEPFPSARARSPKVPESVDRVILRATAKDPTERFESVSEMNTALQAALAYVRDPLTHRAPTIEVPRPGPEIPTPPRRRLRDMRTVRIAAAASAILLLVLALPVFASGLLDLLGRAASPAEGGLEDSAALSAVQLTGQAATIAAMSTELANAPGPTMQEGEIVTAVMQTLAVQTSSSLTTAADPSAAPQFALTSGSGTPSPGSPTFTPSASQPHTPSPVSGSPPAATQSPVPSSTAVQTTSVPTFTQTPTPTSTASPTSPPTPLPPPPTPTQDPCPLLSLGGFTVVGKDVEWVLSNESSTTVQITRIVLDWPAANVRLDRIWFDNPNIWNTGDASPPTDTSSEAGLMGNRKLGGPDQDPSKTLRFQFNAAAQANGYDLQVYLDLGCQVSGGG